MSKTSKKKIIKFKILQVTYIYQIYLNFHLDSHLAGLKIRFLFVDLTRAPPHFSSITKNRSHRRKPPENENLKNGIYIFRWYYEQRTFRLSYVLHYLKNLSQLFNRERLTDGAFCRARVKRTLTSFSPSPIHFEVNDEAEIEKNVAPADPAIHLPMSVFPVPGGPNKRTPLGAARIPRNNSGRFIGFITA